MTNQAFEPKNEQGAIFAFAQMCIGSEWSIVEIRTQFPDAIFEYRGELWNVEFEYCSSNFLNHRHDPRGCDIIICWEHDYKDCPLPVLCLSSDEWKTSSFCKCDPKDLEIEFWKNKSLLLQKRVEYLESRIPEDLSTTNDENFTLLGNEAPDLWQRKRLYQEWLRLGSKNKTLHSVFGGKNGRYAEWLSMAIAENHGIEETHLTN